MLTPQNHGDAAWIYLATYGGGLVDGDALSVDVSVGAGAAAFVSTQASTKVFPSPRGTSIETTARVSDGWRARGLARSGRVLRGRAVPADADVSRRTAAAISCVWTGCRQAGRARGERWAFDEYESRIVVRRDGALVFYDALVLRAADGDLAARLGRFHVLATVAIVGPRFAGETRRVLDEAARTPGRRPDQLLSAAPLGSAGVVFRVAGISVEDVGATLRRTLAFLTVALGDDPWTRKW